MKRAGQLFGLILLILALLIPQVAHGTSLAVKDWQAQATTAHFTIFYNTKGEKAVSEAFVARTAAAMEAAYERLVTKGGLKAPWATRIPVVLSPGSPDVGGTMTPEDLRFRQVISINPKMGDWASLESTAAHELFHALQFNYLTYEPSHHSSKWVLEGTAVAASLLAWDADAAIRTELLRSHLSLYWSAHREPFKGLSYEASLFWYDVASRFGKFRFFDRLFRYAAGYDFESAAQLAALEGGAPSSTTFDSLFRSFALRLLGGELGISYPKDVPASVTPVESWYWGGDPDKVGYYTATAGGLTVDTKPYAYWRPFRLRPYTFETHALTVLAKQPLQLKVEGDPNLETYLLFPQADKKFKAIRVTGSQPLVLEAQAEKQHLTLAVMRTGHYGTGTYQLVFDKPTPGMKAQAPVALGQLWGDPGVASPGSPAALTASELARLKAGEFLGMVPDLFVSKLVVAVAPGQRAYFANGSARTLPTAAATVTTKEGVWLLTPASLASDLGARLEQSGTQVRITYKSTAIDLVPGESEAVVWYGEQGYRVTLGTPVTVHSGHVMVPHMAWYWLGFEISMGGGSLPHWTISLKQ